MASGFDQRTQTISDSSLTSNLPFTINYSSFPNSQLSCQNNINVIPNGPVFPTRPAFPSALPPSLTQFPSTVQTNFLSVRRTACICNIRSSCMILDSGFKGGTNFILKNLPEKPKLTPAEVTYKLLLVGNNGQVVTSDFNKLSSICCTSNINNNNNNQNNNLSNVESSNINLAQQLAREFDDPLEGL